MGLKEKDLIAMSKNPRQMRNRWRGRLRKAAESLSKIKDPVEKANARRMLFAQKKRLQEWELKV